MVLLALDLSQHFFPTPSLFIQGDRRQLKLARWCAHDCTCIPSQRLPTRMPAGRTGFLPSHPLPHLRATCSPF